jgi:hypothetical protein
MVDTEGHLCEDILETIYQVSKFIPFEIPDV